MSCRDRRRLNSATLATAAAACLAAAACGADAPAATISTAPEAAPAQVREKTAGPPVFVDVAAEAGLTAENHTGMPGEKPWLASAMGGGVIVLDYDQDGLMDLVVVDGTMLTDAGDLEFDDRWRTRVFHNDGGLKFTDVTARSGVDIQAFGIGGAACDYDADGFPDFYVCAWGRDFLMRNRGDGTFEDVTAKAGLSGDDFSTACCWGDVNGDGIEDLYVSGYVDMREFIEKYRANHDAGRTTKWAGQTIFKGPRGLVGQPDHLWFGNPDGTFRDVTETNLGPQPPARYGFQPVMTDVDNDGDLDIFVADDGVPNFLWVNDGNGRFTDQAFESGVAVEGGGGEQSAMGVDAADVNRDGWIDIFLTDFAFGHNTLFVNRTVENGPRVFQDASFLCGVALPTRNRVSWGTKLLDYDNDGELDVFAACGQVYGDIPGFDERTASSYRERCALLRGDGAPKYTFADVSGSSESAFRLERVWRGAGFSDFDNDGDLDVFVTALNDRPALFRNDGGNRNNFLVMRLVGGGKLRDACGARVTVYLADGRPHMEELHHGVSFCGDNDPRLFFGLGSESSAARVEVRWPGGAIQDFENVAGRQFYVLGQGKKLHRDAR